MSDIFPPHPFWDFSIATYGRDPVRAACLALQERYGIDVNIALYCLWRGLQADLLAERGWKDFLPQVSAWHENIVKPLRASRRAARLAPDLLDGELVKYLHGRILDVEIATEHAEQLLIAGVGERCFPSRSAPGEIDTRICASANLVRYFRAIGGEIRLPVSDHALVDFIAAAFEISKETAENLLEKAAEMD